MNFKLFFILIVFGASYSCSGLRFLNEKIYKSQKEHLNSSPYQAAKYSLGDIHKQKKIRLEHLKYISKNLNYDFLNHEDTLIISEHYDYICSNCPSISTAVLIGDSVYVFNLKPIKKKLFFDKSVVCLKIEMEGLLQVNEFDDILEIAIKLKNSEEWAESPLEYGMDSCLDGDQTIITVLYPNNSLKSLYVRCWKHYLYRSKIRSNPR